MEVFDILDLWALCLKGSVVCIPPLADLIGHVEGGVAPEGGDGVDF